MRNPETKSKIKYACQQLEVDAIAVNFSNLGVVSATSFGISGNLVLNITILVFDKEGNLIGDGYARSKYTSIRGKMIEEYESKLGEFPFLSDILIKDMAGQKYKP